MPNRNKQKGTRFENELRWALQMLHFYVIRAYSSMGVADLVAVPPWNRLGNGRALLIQCKFTERADYVEPYERRNLDDLVAYSSGRVILAYKIDSVVRMRDWETKEDYPFQEFVGRNYDMDGNYRTLLKNFNNHIKPRHLWAPGSEGEEWNPHQPWKYKV